MNPDSDPIDGEIPARDEDETTTDLARELMAEARRYARAELRLGRDELSQLSAEIRERLRLDVAVARREILVEARRASRAGALTGVGGLLVHAALYLLLFALVFALGRVLPLWAAALIVMGVAAAAGVGLAWGGVKRLRGLSKPRAALENLKGDSQWMRQRIRGLRSRILVSE